MPSKRSGRGEGQRKRKQEPVEEKSLVGAPALLPLPPGIRLVSKVRDQESAVTVQPQSFTEELNAKKCGGTMGYYQGEEDLLLLRYILDNGRCGDTGGLALWQNMEEAGVVVGRSWQSLKERFTRRILKKLDVYDLSAEERDQLRLRVNLAPRLNVVVVPDDLLLEDPPQVSGMVSNHEAASNDADERAGEAAGEERGEVEGDRVEKEETESGREEEEAGEGGGEPELVVSAQLHTFVCMCGFSAEKNKSFRDHGLTRHNCLLCGAPRSNLEGLRKHIKLHHPEVATFVCHCGARFKSLLEKGDHLQTRHACNQCKKDYRKVYILREHIRVKHVGHEYSCGECGKVYSALKRFEKHRQSHKEAKDARERDEETLENYLDENPENADFHDPREDQGEENGAEEKDAETHDNYLDENPENADFHDPREDQGEKKAADEKDAETLEDDIDENLENQDNTVVNTNTEVTTGHNTEDNTDSTEAIQINLLSAEVEKLGASVADVDPLHVVVILAEEAEALEREVMGEAKDDVVEEAYDPSWLTVLVEGEELVTSWEVSFGKGKEWDDLVPGGG